MDLKKSLFWLSKSVFLATPIFFSGCTTTKPSISLTCENASELVVGMSKLEAIDYIKKSGFKARIVREDGQSFFVTKDYRLDRFNLDIEQEKVLGLYCG